jgi:hypothetical protein
MIDWQKEEIALSSQAIHTSYPLSVLASMPSEFDTGIYERGIFGIATPLSIRTLAQVCKTIWLRG